MTDRSPSPRLTLGAPWGAAAALGAALYAGALPPLWGAGVLVLVLIGPLWTFRGHASSILLVYLAVLSGGVLVGNPLPAWRSDAGDAPSARELAGRWSQSGRFDGALPIVLHLVFDELMSPGAAPDAVAGAADLRRAVEEMAARHSLRVFDSVYSRHFFSAEALPDLMNAEYRGQPTLRQPQVDGEGQGVRDNEAFADLERRGYRTAVFQTSHVNFCASAAVDLCETFPSFDPTSVGPQGFGAGSRTAALWRTMARSFEPGFTSRFGRLAIDGIAGPGAPAMRVLGVADRYDVQGFPAWFDRFAAFAADVPRGTHVYAHFMAPHAPYLLTEECGIDGRFDVGYYLASRFPQEARGGARSDFYQRYVRQTRCIVRKLDALLTRIGQAETYRDAVVVIHGDHGSRISNSNVLEDMNERDFIDNYATFFAVRSPGAAPGVDCGFRSLGEAFRRVFVAPDDHHGPIEPVPVSVISRAAGGAQVEARMPIFGCAAYGR